MKHVPYYVEAVVVFALPHSGTRLRPRRMMLRKWVLIQGLKLGRDYSLNVRRLILASFDFVRHIDLGYECYDALLLWFHRSFQ